MIWRIARREFLDWSRDRWRLLAAVGVALVAVAAGLTGAAAAGARASTAMAAQQGDYQRWLSQPPRNAHSATHFGLSAFYVPSRLAVFDPGVSAYAGSALFLEAHKQNEPVFTEAVDRGAAPRFGELSLSTVIQIWLPLIIILLGAGGIAAEREEGILPQLLATGVPSWQLATGKALAMAAAATAVILPSTIVVIVAAGLDAGVWPADALWRIGAILLSLLAYLVFWVALTIAVSARARSWRVAIAGLAIVWCIGVVIAPRLAGDVARARHPLPSRAELDRLELESRIMGPGGVEARRQAILVEHGVASVEQLPVDISVLIARRAEASINARLDTRIALYDRAYADERRDYLRTAVLTPAVAMDIIAAGASGSDDVHHRAFLRRAEDYRRLMMDTLTDADERKPGERARRADVSVWKRMPMFEPAVPAMGQTSSRVGLALAALGAWSLLALALAAWMVRRVGARA
jgi:ABC-2 type transport system permease protein